MGIRVNFSDTEGGTGIREPLPAGKYSVKVTDGEIKESGPNSKHPGSEYISWEFTVQGGPYEGRKVWSNTTLLPHALYGLKGLLDAVGYDVTGELDFEIDDIIGRDLIVRVTKLGARTLDDGREVDERNEVKGFGKPDGSGNIGIGENGRKKSASGSLLP